MDIPIYVTLSVLTAAVFAVFAVSSVVRGVREGAHDANRIAAMVGFALATWFAGITALAAWPILRSP